MRCEWRKLTALLLLLMSLDVSAEDNFGTWAELGIQKELSPYWDLGGEFEYRSQEKDRFGIGVGVGYNPSKYFKLGASYNFLYSHKPEKMNKMEYDEDELVGYRITQGYWTPRHRAGFNATGTVKLWKWLRISLRERYQFTYRPEQTIDRTDFEISESFTPEGSYTERYETPNPKTRESLSTHFLRSRLKLAYDRKKAHLCPFVSCELYNNLGGGEEFNLEKLRASIGADYKITSHHSVTVAYLLNWYIQDDAAHHFESLHKRLHVMNIGYNFKF